MAFTGFDEDTEYQYLLFWITEMPPDAGTRPVPDRGAEVTVEGY